MQIFCDKLKELRKEKHLTTKELAQILQVRDSTISRWENGKMSPSIDMLYKIAVFFGVTSDYLIGLED